MAGAGSQPPREGWLDVGGVINSTRRYISRREIKVDSVLVKNRVEQLLLYIGVCWIMLSDEFIPSSD